MGLICIYFLQIFSKQAQKQNYHTNEKNAFCSVFKIMLMVYPVFASSAFPSKIKLLCDKCYFCTTEEHFTMSTWYHPFITINQRSACTTGSCRTIEHDEIPAVTKFMLAVKSIIRAH